MVHQIYSPITFRTSVSGRRNVLAAEAAVKPTARKSCCLASGNGVSADSLRFCSATASCPVNTSGNRQVLASSATPHESMRPVKSSRCVGSKSLLKFWGNSLSHGQHALVCPWILHASFSKCSLHQCFSGSSEYPALSAFGLSLNLLSFLLFVFLLFFIFLVLLHKVDHHFHESCCTWFLFCLC